MREVGELRRALNAAARKQSFAAAEKIILGEQPDNEIRRLETISKVLTSLSAGEHRDIKIAVVVALVCLTCASLAFAIRVPRAHLHLAIRSDTIALRLSEPIKWTGNLPVPTPEVRLQLPDTEELSFPPEVPAIASAVSSRGTASSVLNITGGDFVLTRLEMDKGGLLVLSTQRGTGFSLLFKDASVQGEAQLFGLPTIAMGEGTTQTSLIPKERLDVPGILAFRDGGHSSTIPFWLRMNAQQSITFSNLAVRGLSFDSNTFDGARDQTIDSGIVSGTVTVADTGESFSLNQNARLDLGSTFTGVISELVVSKDNVAISIDGTASQALVGPEGVERDLKPSILEYFYHKTKIGFFWSSVTFLWGVIWSLKKLLAA